MSPRSKTARVKPPLTDLETAVMRAVWDRSVCSVEAAHEVVSRTFDLEKTTVRTILRRLEQKGYVRHRSVGRVYVYSATEPQRRFAARAVRQLIDRFCLGSVEELVTGMVEADVLSPDEIRRLEASARARRDGGGS